MLRIAVFDPQIKATINSFMLPSSGELQDYAITMFVPPAKHQHINTYISV